MRACKPDLGYVHFYTDGSGMEMEVEGVKMERLSAKIYARGFTGAYHHLSNYAWWNVGHTVASRELFGICQALSVLSEEEETDLHIFAMVTIHRI